MTVEPQTPVNPNFLSKGKFLFSIKNTPNFNYFVQKVSIPELELPAVNQSTPMVRIPRPGDQPIFSPLFVLFKLDEEAKNYQELFDWMIRTGGPVSFEAPNNIYHEPVASGRGITSDISVFLLNSAQNPKIEITFLDAFPVRLGGFELDSTVEESEDVISSVMFAYRAYEFHRI